MTRRYIRAMQPDQAVFILNAALPALRHEHRITRSVISAIPLDQGDYRPDPVTKSAMELAWHIVAAELRFLSGIAGGEFDFSARPRPESITNSAGLGAYYESAWETEFAKVAALTPEQLVKILDFHGMLQLPAIAYLQFAQNHSIHHRGQLSMYLRPMGAKVPSIYGESHDVAEARKAAQAGGN